MSEFPSLPLFTDAFLADTGHLNAQETGAYLLLMMVAWRSPANALPDDDVRLAKWARVDQRTWKRIKPMVMEFWKLADGLWRQKRLSKEREIVSKRAEIARMNGKQSARSKVLKTLDAKIPAGSLSETKTPTPSPNPISKGDGGGDARAKPPKISQDAFAFADELALLCAQDLQFLTPQWMAAGTPRRVQVWLDAGWRVDVMREQAIATVRKKRDGPPATVAYFEKIFARAHAPQLPLPPVLVTESSHVIQQAATTYQGSRDAFRTARAKLKAAVAGGSGEEAGGSNVGGPALRFVAPAGRGGG